VNALMTTRPETGSSARVDFETHRLRTFVEGLSADELERRSGATKLSAVAQALEANPKAVLFDDAGGHPLSLKRDPAEGRYSLTG
jgi:hypothetical protein